MYTLRHEGKGQVTLANKESNTDFTNSKSVKIQSSDNDDDDFMRYCM